MSFQVSPGVRVREIDLTNVVPAVSSSIGGFAGAFSWGPVEEVRQVTSEKNLAETFGVPSLTNNTSYFTAAGFLQYGNNLQTVRCETAGLKNAIADGTGTAVLIKGQDSYDASFSAGQASVGPWAAKYPGTLGNSLKVEICAPGHYATWTNAANFDSAPGTSQYAESQGVSAALDELHILVIDEGGQWTGTAGSVLEKFAFVSQASDAKLSNGESNFYKDVINARSAYIWWMDHDSVLTDAGTALSTAASGFAFTGSSTVITDSLTLGVDDNTLTASAIQTGFDLMEDGETLDVNMLICPPLDNSLANASSACVAVANDLIAIATARKDCLAVISPPVQFTSNPAGQSITDVNGGSVAATAVNNVVAFADYLTSSSYGTLDSTALKVYDKYNDVFIDIPSSGHVAGLMANTDTVADAWFSPAGFTRGQILGVTRVSFNPKKAERDTLYKARVNPIVSFPGEGTVLFGDKTLLSRPSAFDRINVRRLFMVLEKAVATASKFQLFEFNDEFTRAQFRNLVEPFLREVKGRRGITDFKVVCDETNNTGQVIDANEFVCDIYIKPARSINFITLNFIATRTGVDFDEIAG
jgi:phage tail sheath protein FI